MRHDEQSRISHDSVTFQQCLNPTIFFDQYYQLNYCDIVGVPDGSLSWFTLIDLSILKIGQLFVGFYKDCK